MLLNFDNAFIISQSDSIRFNQIFGDEMNAYIDNQKVSEVDVINNGKSIYFIRDDNNKLIGVNFIECKNMNIYLKDNKLDKIWFYKKPTGKINPPLTLSQSETLLDGFKWEEKNRPLKKADIFIWNNDVIKKLSEDTSDKENTENKNLKE